MNKYKRYKILYRLSKINSNLKVNLNYNSSFELLISLILSSKTNDNNVNKTTKILFKKANTPQQFLKLGINKLKKYIKSVGLFNKKAESIIKTCKILINVYNSQIPNKKNEILSLPGVGNKISNIFLNIIFNRKLIAVDTHVFRVCNRTRFVTGNNVNIIEHKLNNIVTNEFKKNCHMIFMNHGKYICTAKKTKCRICAIEDLCEHNIRYN